MKQTSKKVKVIGTQQYVDTTTGELVPMQVVSIEDRDFNFHKLWLSHIINSLDLIGNKKVKLAFWIIEHLNKENQLIMTYRQIAEGSGISLDTVRVTMAALIESNFLIRLNQGAYQVNPDVIFKGTREGRLNVLYQYSVEREKQAQRKTQQEQEQAEQEQEQPQPQYNDQIDGQMVIVNTNCDMQEVAQA